MADPDSVIIAEQRNISALPGGDPTQHAELVALANAWKAIVIGPLLEDEAARAHQGYWRR